MIQQAELLAASFADPATAKKCLDQLKQMEKSGSIDLIDAAIVVKQADGKLKIDELEEFTPKKGRRRGAVIGGIFGAIFPPSLLISALVGGAAGGLLGRFTDQGMENDELKRLGEALEPGHSAIVAIVEDKWVQHFTSAVEGYDKLSRIALDAETAAVIVAAEDTETGDTATGIGVRVTGTIPAGATAPQAEAGLATPSGDPDIAAAEVSERDTSAPGSGPTE